MTNNIDPRVDDLVRSLVKDPGEPPAIMSLVEFSARMPDAHSVI